MATISSPGIGSGLDVQSIVSQLVALEKAPLTQLKTQATSFETRLSTYGTIKSQIAALGDAATKLSTSKGWNAVTAASSNAAAIGVTAASGAPASAFTMTVQQLAKAQSTASSAVAVDTAMGSGSMTIELGSWSAGTFTPGTGTPMTIDITAGEDSLAEIAAKINDAGAGVTATVLRDASGERLLMRSSETGATSGFRIAVTDDDGNDTDGAGLSRLAYAAGNANGMALTQAGQNALATVDGVSISSTTNRLANTLSGLTIQLSQVTTDPVEISVTNDLEAVRANVQAFIDNYNTLNTTLANATRYDASTKVAGALQGDSTATGLQNALRSMMRSVTGSTPFSRLTDIGIEMQTGGKLALDSEKFDAALNDLDGLSSLFTIDTGAVTTEGFGRKIKNFANGLIDADGLVSTKTSAIQSAIRRNSLEQEKVNDRAARAEVRYLAQYNAMDAAVAKLNGINAFVTQQITLWNNA
jgi:flagellar hook-associated protein 2